MSSPNFITWKKYGFRHIVRADKLIDGYHQGSALCGNEFWVPPQGWDTGHDIRGTGRPLCGACRKAWKKKTGEEIS
jgi:hypothetical protein